MRCVIRFEAQCIIREIRNFLSERGYVEVETPIMQAIPGGAARGLSSRITTPLAATSSCALLWSCTSSVYWLAALIEYLRSAATSTKASLAGITRNSPCSRPTSVWRLREHDGAIAIHDCHVSEKVLGTLVIEQKDEEGNVTKTIDLTPDWRRAKYKDLVREKAGNNWFELTPEQRRARATEELKIEIDPEEADFEVTNAVFEKLIEPTLIQPTFVTHLPKELVPLAKLSPEDPDCVEVLSAASTAGNCPGLHGAKQPIEQRERLEQQAGGEQQKLDEDFLVALEHGMPLAGGIGIGIDRLCIMLLGQESIRDVILFPQLKPREE